MYHCPAGEKNCLSGDPDSNSAVYKFTEPEKYNLQISEDDRAGLQFLYGKLTDNEKRLIQVRKDFQTRVLSFCENPCKMPEEESATYRIRDIERIAWNEYLQDRTNAGMETETEKLKLYREFEKSYIHSYRVTGISAEEYMMDSIEYVDSYMYVTPTEFIDSYIQTLYVDIKNRERSLNDFKNELDPNYLSFVESELKALIQFRRIMINEKASR